MTGSQEFLTVGKVRDAHGLSGELFIVLFAKESSWREKLNEVRLVRREKDEDGKLQEVPHSFSIKKAKPHKVGLILKVEGVRNRTEAEGFQGAHFQIPKELLVSKKGETIFLKEIEGFQVSRKGKLLGEIVGFSSNGPQDLIRVKTETGEFEIPLIPEFLLQLRWTEKVLDMEFPEGLLGEEA